MEILVEERFQSISRKIPETVKVVVKKFNHFWKNNLFNYRNKDSDDERIEKDDESQENDEKFENERIVMFIRRISKNNNRSNNRKNSEKDEDELFNKTDNS